MVSSAIAPEATENVNEHTLRPVQVIAVTGGKGGVGKSSVTINLALELGKRGRDVLVLDADLGLANIDVLCGIESSGSLADVIRGDLSLNDILLQVNEHVSLLPASSGISGMTGLTRSQLGGLIQAFSEMHAPIDTLLIDTPTGINENVTAFCKAAREVIVMVCDEPTSVADALATIRVLGDEHQIKRIHILVNKSEGSDRALDLYDELVLAADRIFAVSNTEVMLNYLGTIPNDEQLRSGVSQQSPVVQSYPGSKASRAFSKLAKTVDSWPEPATPVGHVEFFVERLVKQGVTQ